jgi:hypothetical protein
MLTVNWNKPDGLTSKADGEATQGAPLRSGVLLSFTHITI